MREILFRGKRIDNGEWIYGSLIQWKNGDTSIVVPKGHINEKNGIEDAESYPVDPSTVGQYTGLCDCEGNKVFEGDIVKQGYYQSAVYYGEFNCSCCDGVYGWSLGLNCDIRDLSEVDSNRSYGYVIGNVYDNLKLLKEE